MFSNIWFQTKPTASALLLDQAFLSGKVDIAYGMRKLKSTSTKCIRIKRVSDSVQQDIGFSGNDIDSSAITSFIGSSTGDVVTIYDQSGNGNDALITDQDPTKVVITGTLQTINGKTCIFTPATGNVRLYLTNEYTRRYDFCINVAAERDGSSGLSRAFFGGPAGAFTMLYNDEHKLRALRNQQAELAITSVTLPQQLNTVWTMLNQTKINLGYNTAHAETTVTASISQNIQVINASGAGDNIFRGKWVEQIFHTANSVADCQTIENDQRTYYGIT
jgi:hypothetical protein